MRIAEERRGREVQDNTVSLMVTKSQNLSPYIASLCMEAKQTTFAPEQILQQYKDGRVGYRRDGRRLTNFPINKKYSSEAMSYALITIIYIYIMFFPSS